jgi:hypothetical protein
MFKLSLLPGRAVLVKMLGVGDLFALSFIVGTRM